MKTRLSAARDRVRRCKDILGDGICVGLSGGKDSLVTLDLCREVFGQVEAFYMYVVCGLRCIENHIDAAAKRAGVIVHYVPHWDLSRMFKYAVLRPHVPAAEKLRIMSQKDVERALTAKTGIRTFAYGERASDSFVRRFYTRENDGLRIRAERSKIYPIWDWLDADVYGYLRAKNIPLPPRFGRSRKQSGFSLEPDCLQWLKDNHPHDYAKVLEIFPYAESQLIVRTDEIPGVPGGARRTWKDYRSEIQPEEDQPDCKDKAQEAAEDVRTA